KLSSEVRRSLQKLIANWLNLHSIYYEWDRTDKKASGKRGRADFRICVPPGGVWLSAECKAAVGSLSPEQAAEAARLRNSGGRFVVVYSLGDLIEAIRGIEAPKRRRTKSPRCLLRDAGAWGL